MVGCSESECRSRFPMMPMILLGPPDAAEARTIAGGVASAVARDGELTGLQRLLIEALIESMTTFVVPVRQVPRLGPERVRRALARRNEPFRQRMLQFMLVCALVLVPLPDEVVKRIEEYAFELGVSNDMLRVAQRYAHGSLGVALIDFQRSGYMETWDPSQRGGAAHHPGLERCVGAVRVSIRRSRSGGKRYATCRTTRWGGPSCGSTTPAASRFPGLPGSAPPLLAQHDWVHVIADYGSSVESELEVFAFISRANDDPRAFSLLAMVISLFETGYLAIGRRIVRVRPRASLARGHGRPPRRRDAPRRARRRPRRRTRPAQTRLVRRRPTPARRRPGRARRRCRNRNMRSNADPSHPGNPAASAPYQYDCGQSRALAAGRTYESYGAEPI